MTSSSLPPAPRHHCPSTPLVQVTGEFGLGSDTTALAVNFLDRLLSAVVVPSTQLQTASLACLFVASKLLERRPLSMRQIAKYFRDIATPDDVTLTELNILFYLRWDMNAFTTLDFVRTTLQLVPDPEIRTEIAKRAEAMHTAAMLGALRRARPRGGGRARLGRWR